MNIECYSSFGLSELNKSIRYFTKLDDILNKKETEYKRMMQINLIKKSKMSLPKKFIEEQIKKPNIKYMRLVLIRLDQTDNFGYDAGYSNGEELGHQTALKETAKNLLKMDFVTIEQISEATGLSIHKINDLK